MDDLLFLCHRIPYPPDKGEKIRAWNLLRGLAERHRIHLGAFVDDPEDWAGREALEAVCADVHLVWLDRRIAKLRSLAAIVTGESLSVAFYRHRGMRRWVESKLAAGMDNVFVYSSTMAQYAQMPDEGVAPIASRSCTSEGGVRHPETDTETSHAAAPRTTYGDVGDGPVEAVAVGAVSDRESAQSALQEPTESTPLRAVSRSETAPTGPTQTAEGTNPPVGGASARRALTPSPAQGAGEGWEGGSPATRFVTITDYVDVDSEKWRSYAESGGALAWIYRLEAHRLAAFERRQAARADHTLLVTEAERECFLRGAPELAPRVHAVPNGVDTDYFSPEQRGQSPFGETPALVFTGAMDYRPNVEAVLWFAREIFPRIREREPGAELYIVGLRPTSAVQALAEQPGITVTGRVPDVRPYVGHAAAVVAPLTIARGVQNKVLEAMAMAKAVVCTPQALEGIGAKHGEQLFVASHPKPFVEAVLALLQRPERARELGEAALHYVREHHGWAASVAMIETLLTGEPPVGAQLPCANFPSAEAESSRSEAALPQGNDARRSCTAEGGVRRPQSELEASYAAAPRTTYGAAGDDAAGEIAVGAVSDRDTARSGVLSEGSGSALRALSRSETAPTEVAPTYTAPADNPSSTAPVGAQLRCANSQSAEPESSHSDAALPHENDARRSCTAEGRVRHPAPDGATSHAPLPRTTDGDAIRVSDCTDAGVTVSIATMPRSKP